MIYIYKRGKVIKELKILLFMKLMNNLLEDYLD